VSAAMKRNHWIVGDEGIRPVSRDKNVCTYCREPRGNTHKPECVIRQRTVVMRLTVEYVATVVESFDQEMIEFQRNEGTRCADNTIIELAERIERYEKQGTDEHDDEHVGRTCFCGTAREEYVREATEHDEMMDGIYVAKCEG